MSGLLGDHDCVGKTTCGGNIFGFQYALRRAYSNGDCDDKCASFFINLRLRRFDWECGSCDDLVVVPPTRSPAPSTTPPTDMPSTGPSPQPSEVPSLQPTSVPSLRPSSAPSSVPSVQPSSTPSVPPSNSPSSVPSVPPSDTPSVEPSPAPSAVPSLLPSLAPSQVPSMAPSEFNSTNTCPETCGSFTEFTDRDTLRQAVDDYLADDSFTSEVALLYGHPIGTWCVGKVTDFSALFSANRNQRASFFNDDLGCWDMSKATTVSEMFHDAKDFNSRVEKWNVGRE